MSAFSHSSASATRAASVTPSDTADMARAPVGLYIGGGGDVAVEMVGGGTVTFVAVAGAVLPIQPRKVLATGTTATGIIALYN